MKDGFVKVMAGAPEIRVADCEYNIQKIAECMQKAENNGVELLVLPELCLTGHTCGDLFHQKTLLDSVEDSMTKLLTISKTVSLITLVGAPYFWEGKLYNCAFVLHKGKLLGIVPKTHLPNYKECDEMRYFVQAPAQVSEAVFCGQSCPFGINLLFTNRDNTEFTFAVEIGEDGWAPNPPCVRHALAGAIIIANLSASNEIVGKAQYRRQLVCSLSARLLCGYLYADAGIGESTTDMVFSGHSLIAENGTLLVENQPFDMHFAATEIDLMRLEHDRMCMNLFPVDSRDYTRIFFQTDRQKEFVLTRECTQMPFVPQEELARAERCESILTMQAEGLARRILHTHAKVLVIGISGGLDSCLALLVAVRAMDRLKRERKDILAVTMPCFGTTKRTRGNAEILCEELGVNFRCIDIAAAVKQHFADLGHDADQLDTTFENSQARERTQILMDIANQENGMVIGTGDLSELALGWATYNGDHMSMYGVNASIPKTLVRYLVSYFADICNNKKLSDTLRDIVDTPVSPELLPHEDGKIAQKTEDLVGPYELHDFFLYYMLRFGFSPKRIFLLAQHAFHEIYEDTVILKWLKTFLRRFFTQQFKRSCLPDGPKVGTISLSPRGDFRMPSDAQATLWLREVDSILR